MRALPAVLCAALALAAGGGCGGARRGGASAGPSEPLSNVLPPEPPRPVRPPGEAAVAAPRPTIEIPPLGMSLVLVVDGSGDVYISGILVPDEDLDDVLMRAAATDPGRQLVLQADGGVAHSRVVYVMQRAKAAGFTRMAIGTTRADMPPERPWLWRSEPLPPVFEDVLRIGRGGGGVTGMTPAAAPRTRVPSADAGAVVR